MGAAGPQDAGLSSQDGKHLSLQGDKETSRKGPRISACVGWVLAAVLGTLLIVDLGLEGGLKQSSAGAQQFLLHLPGWVGPNTTGVLNSTVNYTELLQPVVDTPLPVETNGTLVIPKVALLFLTRGDMPHNRTWESWFKSVEGLVPRDAVRAAACPSTADGEQPNATQPVTAPALPETPYLGQYLYSVYMHPAPDFKGYPRDSIFAGREIEGRVQVWWGTHSLMNAERRLVQEALKDPANQVFVLLCEASVPLYPAHVMYNQLIGEKRSHLAACGGDTMSWRFTWRMEIPGVLNTSVWRKSSQWWILNRKHANIVATDFILNAVFEKYCWAGHDNDLGRYRDCYSDEHYTPTLLAVHGEGTKAATTCNMRQMYAEWHGGSHPRTFWKGDLKDDTFYRIRDPNGRCRFKDALKSSEGLLMPASNVSQYVSSYACAAPDAKPETDYRLMADVCALFARKFDKETAVPLHEMLTGCTSRLKILPNATDCKG